MTVRKLLFALILCNLLVVGLTCKRSPDELGRIEILSNQYLGAAARPMVLAKDLNNPESPLEFEGNVVFSQSGSGEVSMVSQKGGQVTPLITGFPLEDYSGYKISAQGIAIDPLTKQWIVCSAAGAGNLLAFTAPKFPTNARSGREIKLEGAVEDNPYDVVLAAGGRIIASGGTSKAYAGHFPSEDPWVLKSFFAVKTGITGLAIDPKSGAVFGAVYGSSKPDGSIIRFQPTLDQPSITTVATGFTNLVDVAFTSDGELLALEFGSLVSQGEQTRNDGAISIVATDGSGRITPFIRGLANPTGLFVSSNRNLLITEFGSAQNSQRGTLISIPLTSGHKD
jgi:hypothetical protein